MRPETLSVRYPEFLNHVKEKTKQNILERYEHEIFWRTGFTNSLRSIRPTFPNLMRQKVRHKFFLIHRRRVIHVRACARARVLKGRIRSGETLRLITIHSRGTPLGLSRQSPVPNSRTCTISKPSPVRTLFLGNICRNFESKLQGFRVV